MRQFQNDWKDFVGLENVVAWSCYISKGNKRKADEFLPVITYVAGYCAYSLSKKLQCYVCKLVLTSSGKTLTALITV